jgi:aspartate/glutamate racemase
MLYGVFPSGVSFDPEKEIPSLDGKVIFITGGMSAALDAPYYEIIANGSSAKATSVSESNPSSNSPSTTQNASTSQPEAKRRPSLRSKT